MKAKKLYLLFLLTGLSCTLSAQITNKTTPAQEKQFNLWLQNTDSASCKHGDTVDLSFFTSEEIRFYCTIPFSVMKEVWVVLQQEGKQATAWKLNNLRLPSGLIKTILNMGGNTRITISVRTKSDPDHKGFVSVFYVK